MSSTTSRIPGLFLIAAFVSLPANAQVTPVVVTAPVPGQILTAKRMFISNAGSESYGSQSYFRLTRYDGGPDRFYNQFYAAMKNWGHYELADSPADADVVCEVRFTSPIVDKQSPYELVYDPQLNLTIVDPKTRVALWSLTEHIQPARNKEGDNKNFDQAVSRIVDQTKMLGSSSASLPTGVRPQTITEFAPVGAVETARAQDHWQHAWIGSLIGGTTAGLIAWRVIQPSCSGGLDCATADGIASLNATFKKRFAIDVGGAVAGGLIGWLWRTH
jgi:hypothetical protein